MLIKEWTPATPVIEHHYVTAGSLAHSADQALCGTGWKYDGATGHIST